MLTTRHFWLNSYTIMDTCLNNWKDKLVKIYVYICEKSGQSLQYECQRFTNNDQPDFTDQEMITIYLFAMHHQKLFKIKDIYRYAKDHLINWFPNLNSYQAFNNRLNSNYSANLGIKGFSSKLSCIALSTG